MYQRTSFQSWRRDHGGWKRKGGRRRASGPDRKTNLAVIFRDRDLRFPVDMDKDRGKVLTCLNGDGVYNALYRVHRSSTLPAKTMSISIDDLVSSFSSAHVGQEQSDLAALQVSSLDATRSLFLTLISGTACRESLRRLILCIILAYTTTASTPALYNAHGTQPNDGQLHLGRHRRRLSVEVLQHLKPRA